MKLLAYFPFSAAVQPNDLSSFIRSVLVYLIGGGVLGVILKLAGLLPIFGIVARLISIAVGIYCLVGFILTVLRFLNKEF